MEVSSRPRTTSLDELHEWERRWPRLWRLASRLSVGAITTIAKVRNSHNAQRKMLNWFVSLGLHHPFRDGHHLASRKIRQSGSRLFQTISKYSLSARKSSRSNYRFESSLHSRRRHRVDFHSQAAATAASGNRFRESS